MRACKIFFIYLNKIILKASKNGSLIQITTKEWVFYGIQLSNGIIENVKGNVKTTIRKVYLKKL